MSRAESGKSFETGEMWSDPTGLCWSVMSVSDDGTATLRNGPHWAGGRDIQRSVTATKGWQLELEPRASRKEAGDE